MNLNTLTRKRLLCSLSIHVILIIYTKEQKLCVNEERVNQITYNFQTWFDKISELFYFEYACNHEKLEGQVDDKQWQYKFSEGNVLFLLHSSLNILPKTVRPGVPYISKSHLSSFWHIIIELDRLNTVGSISSKFHHVKWPKLHQIYKKLGPKKTNFYGGLKLKNG